MVDAGSRHTGGNADLNLPDRELHDVFGPVVSRQEHIMVAAGGAPAKGGSGSTGGSTDSNLPDRELRDVFGPVLSEAVVQTPTSGVDLGGDEGDSPDKLVLDVSERGRLRRKSFKLLATEVGEAVESVTTVIAKGMRQVVKLQPDMRARADSAIVKEIRNLLTDHKAMSGAHYSVTQSGDEVLPCSVYVEDKRVNGEHLKDRAHIVAGGHRQDKSKYVNLSTQTVNTESVFMLLAVVVFEKKEPDVI